MKPSDSVKSTSGASASSESTGQLSLFGETCERSRPAMFPTPQAQLAKHAAPTDWEREHRPSHLHVMASASSPQGIPASHSQSPGSGWARKMTATYGRRLSDYWLSSGPPDSWVRTLLGTSRWGSMLCYLTWKKSATPHGRLLFRLAPSTPRTAGIGSGFWGTPTTRDYKDTGDMTNVPENGLLGRQVLNDARMWPTPKVGGGGNTGELTPYKGHWLRPSGKKADFGLDQAVRMWPTPRASENELRTTKPTPSQIAGTHGKSLSGEVQMGGKDKLNSAWVSRLMGYPDDWLTLDGEEIR